MSPETRSIGVFLLVCTLIADGSTYANEVLDSGARLLSIGMQTFQSHLRRGTLNNSIFVCILKVVNVLLIVHDSRNLLLGRGVGLGGQ